MTNANQGPLAELPALPSGYVLTDLATACALTASDSPNTYHCDLKPDWAIGAVPHGGYLAALITYAAQKFALSHPPPLQHQPDLITLHQEFISACVFGPASITITVLSRGRQYSTLRVQLFQQQKPYHGTEPPVLRIETILRQGSLQMEQDSGNLSLPTHAAAPPPPRSTCIEHRDPPGLFERRIAHGKVIFLLSMEANEMAVGPAGPSVREQWVRWRDPAQRFDSLAALAYLADTHRPLIEAYGVVGMWYPTLNMGLDVKRQVPVGGWEWLFMRVEIRECKDGRFDYDVVILDEGGGLVALSRHACLIVSAERNWKRGGGGKI